MKKATAKVTENRDAVTVEEHVNFAVDAATEAYDAVEGSVPAKQTAAAEAFRRCMPLLESRSSVRGFIACVAQGVRGPVRGVAVARGQARIVPRA